MREQASEILDELITDALSVRASDIHIEPSFETYTIRLRIDGFLLPHTHELLNGTHIIARIKVLASMNVAEKRIPQDGKFTSSLGGGACDIRVATFPCMYGEKVVLRLLARNHTALQLTQLGLSPSLYQTIVELSQRSNGFFLATGPTGSGKTTLLHAVLSHIKSIHTNIMTLEDPVEYTIEGITQTAIHPSIGLTFESGLRSLLRLDPDVIMVGEIRDTETAHVAFKAALTGHFVVSTLHTIDAPSALLRLIDMGIQPFLINATISGIVAQRLARRLCSLCKIITPLSSKEKSSAIALDISLTSFYTSPGCTSCKGTGTQGRIGIFELLTLSPSLQALLQKPSSYRALAQQAQKEGMISLLEDALAKVHEGLISFAELLRICL